MNSRTVAAVAFVALTAAAAPVRAGKMSHVEHRTETRSLALAAVGGQRELVVDNVIGSVEVRAGAASDGAIEVAVKVTYAAESAAELERAKREVELEIRESAGRLELVQGGSWRCRARRDGQPARKGSTDADWEGDCCCDRHDDRDYEVRFDWTITVPRQLDLTVRNVNDGAIRVEGVSGRLRVRHVNDDVTLADVSGRVDAKTVNGELKVDFRAQPSGDSKFATVNGDIDLGFPKGLGAKLSFATLNGEVFTDFPFELATSAPPPAAERAGRRGGRHHGSGRRTSATLGAGGFALDCDTVNGDITIRELG